MPLTLPSAPTSTIQNQARQAPGTHLHLPTFQARETAPVRILGEVAGQAGRQGPFVCLCPGGASIRLYLRPLLVSKLSVGVCDVGLPPFAPPNPAHLLRPACGPPRTPT